MKTKLYFKNDSEELVAYPKSILIEEMKESGITEMLLNECVVEKKSNYFYCKAVGKVCKKGDTYDPCGRECELYKPRNGVSGCCKHQAPVYKEGKELVLTIKGKLNESVY